MTYRSAAYCLQSLYICVQSTSSKYKADRQSNGLSKYLSPFIPKSLSNNLNETIMFCSPLWTRIICPCPKVPNASQLSRMTPPPSASTPFERRNDSKQRLECYRRWCIRYASHLRSQHALLPAMQDNMLDMAEGFSTKRTYFAFSYSQTRQHNSARPASSKLSRRIYAKWCRNCPTMNRRALWSIINVQRRAVCRAAREICQHRIGVDDSWFDEQTTVWRRRWGR